jgi:hypothetical protein
VDLVVFVVIVGALVIGGWLMVGPTSQARATEARYPVALLPVLDDAVAAQGSAARLFNEYTWGGWLIAERPSVPVFIDGAPEGLRRCPAPTLTPPSPAADRTRLHRATSGRDRGAGQGRLPAGDGPRRGGLRPAARDDVGVVLVAPR